MNQSINTVLHLDKRAEVGQVPNPSCDYGTNGVTFRQRRPWIRLRLFETKRYAAIVHVHVKHEGFDILADLKQLRRMLHALAPGHLRHMNESLDSGFQLDERAVVGQVLYGPTNLGVFFEHLKCKSLLARLFGFQDKLAGKNNIAAFAVELDDSAFDLFAPESIQVFYRSNINLRTREEST